MISILLALIPVALALIIYSPVLQNGLVWDDVGIFQEQLPRLQNLLQPFFHHEIVMHGSSYFRPMVFFVYLLNRMVGGYSPTTFHATVLLLHGFNTFLVFLLTQQFLRERPEKNLAAFLASLLFSIHPIHLEVVSWISGTPDVLMTTFCLSSFVCFLQYQQDPSKRRWLLGFSLTFFLGLLTKETAIVLIFLYLLYPFIFFHEKKCPRKIFFFAFGFVFLAYFFLRWVNAGTVNIPSSDWSLETLKKLISALGYYLLKIFIPMRPDPYIPSFNLTRGFLLSSCLFLVGLSLLGLKKFRPSPTFVFHILFFLLTLAPGLGSVFLTTSATPLAERYLYLPSYGFVFIVGSFLGRFFLQKTSSVSWKISMSLSLFVLLIFFGWLSRKGLKIWKDDTSYWSYVSSHHANESRPLSELVRVYALKGDCLSAKNYFDQTINIKEPSPLFAASPYLYLGFCLNQTGHPNEAKQLYQKSISIYPLPNALLNLAILLIQEAQSDPTQQKQLYQQAKRACTFAYQKEPYSDPITMCLGITQAALDRLSSTTPPDEKTKEKNNPR